MEKKKEPLYTVSVQGMSIGMGMIENSMEVPQKRKVELPYNPAIPLPGTYPKEMKSVSQRDICTPMFIIHNSQDMKTT